MAKDLKSINITFYADEDGLKRVVCEDTDINLEEIKKEALDDWFRVSSEITFVGMVQDIFDTFTEDFEELEEDEDEDEDDDDDDEDDEEEDEHITDINALLKQLWF